MKGGRRNGEKEEGKVERRRKEKWREGEKKRWKRWGVGQLRSIGEVGRDEGRRRREER